MLKLSPVAAFKAHTELLIIPAITIVQLSFFIDRLFLEKLRNHQINFHRLSQCFLLLVELHIVDER